MMMHRSLFVAAVCLLFATGCTAQRSAPVQNADIKGRWEGRLDLGQGHSTLVVLEIGSDRSKLIATLQTPEESSRVVIADSVAFKGDALTVRVSQRQATIVASERGSELRGQFKQNKDSLPLTLRKTAGS